MSKLLIRIISISKAAKSLSEATNKVQQYTTVRPPSWSVPVEHGNNPGGTTSSITGKCGLTPVFQPPSTTMSK